MNRNFVITVARGFGTGGKEIASKVSNKLGIHCYENRILTLASKMSGIAEAHFFDADEKLREAQKKQLTNLMEKLPRANDYIPCDEEFVSNEVLFNYQKEIIEHLANTESCVIVGKCADWILKDRKNVISVYIEAPRAFCVTRTMAHMGVSEKKAHKIIAETDAYRAEYYAHYTNGNYWTNPVNYDITLNSERLNIDTCVNLILETLKSKLPHLLRDIL